MNMKWISRKLRYLLLNPKYFYLYFFGRPEKVICAVTGRPEELYYRFRREFAGETDFINDLSGKMFEITGTRFELNIDHYFLYSLVRTIGPAVVLETGVFHGHYTACILKGIHDNYRDDGVDGKVVSIDLPAYAGISESTSETESKCLPPGCEPGWVVPDYLRDRWHLHIGDSRDLLPELLEQESTISLFFHDSLHTYEHMMYEFETVYPRLAPGGYLISHDVHWNRAFRHFVKKNNQREFAVHGFGIFRKQKCGAVHERADGPS